MRNEYTTIKAEPLGGTTTFFQKNTQFNRYGNVQLVDETRVVLNDGLENDYIHASRVDGYKMKGEFILTQAPLRTTAREYWRMVWQERVQVCICLTTMQEDGVEKSAHFFPLSTDRPYRAGPFRILLLGTEEQMAPRRLVVARVKLSCWFAPTVRRERIIFMVFYGDWPDRGVPSNPTSFLDIFDGVRKLQQNAWLQMRHQIDYDKGRAAEIPPLLINCSAGIGRSATLTSCFIEVDRLRDCQRVDVAAGVRRLRRQRAGAVQNVMQYQFICRIIVEAWTRLGNDRDDKSMINQVGDGGEKSMSMATKNE